MADGKPSAAFRILGLVVALGLVGWVAWDRITALSPAPIFEAIQAADPTLANAAVEMNKTIHFRDSDGRQKPRLALWCGSREGRADGSIAVVARAYRSRPIIVEELALGWDAALTDRQRWLLSECRRVRP